MLSLNNSLNSLKTSISNIQSIVSTTNSNVTTLQTTITPTRQKVQVFTSSGTWVKPANTMIVDLLIVGAGGNGNGAGGSTGGGGGSGYFHILKGVPVSGNVTVTIGATSGASTSFGIYTALGGDNANVPGGGNGYSGGGSSGGGSGGSGGSNGTGPNGYGLGVGTSNISNIIKFGNGGTGVNAGGGGGGIIIYNNISAGNGIYNSSVTGYGGVGYGAGGGGTNGGGTNGAGAQGICIVTWFE